jgi:sugar lactone lactonase YvrE
MRIARVAAIAAVLVGMLAVAPIGAMAGTKHSAIFVANSYNVAAFPTGSHGNVAPIALNTEMADPIGLARDKSGRIYVVNNGTNTVTVYSANANGNVEPVAVIGGSNSQLALPTAIALDASENIYVVNGAANSQSINVYPALGTSAGILNEAPIGRIAGSKTMLDYPTGIALDSKGNIYVANASGGPVVPHEIYNVGRITIYPPGSNGNVAPAAVISGKQTGLALPLGIALGSHGNIYVANLNTANVGNPQLNNSSITVYTPGNNGDAAPIAIIAGDKTGLVDARGIALDSDGNLYTEGSVNQRGFSINVYPRGSDGNVAPATTISGPDTGVFFPDAIALDADRNLYVLNNEGGPVGSGLVTIYPAGSSDNAIPSSTISSNFTGLNGPSGVALDSTGNIYVANAFAGDGGIISIYSPDSYATDGPPIAIIAGADTGLSNPYGVVVESNGNIYALNVPDYVTVYPTGSVGNAAPSVSFSIEARPFANTKGIAVARGKLYVALGSIGQCNRRSCEEVTSGRVFIYRTQGSGNPSTIISGPNTGLASPSAIAVDHEGKIYVANQGALSPKTGCQYQPDGSITIYGPNSSGDAAPIGTIAGPNTGLGFPDGIAFDSSGNIYVSNALNMLGVCLSFPTINAPTEGDILIFAAGSNGDVAPIGTIRGPATGLNNPLGLAIGPMIQ